MDTVLSLLVLAIVALVGGAVLLWRRGGSRLHVALMLILAMVATANIAIWTVPGADGTAPLGQTPQRGAH